MLSLQFREYIFWFSIFLFNINVYSNCVKVTSLCQSNLPGLLFNLHSIFKYFSYAEEAGSPSQHALQLVNIQSRNFLQCLLEKLWKFISFFRQEYLIFLKVSFYGCFKYESNLTTFALFGILMTSHLC